MKKLPALYSRPPKQRKEEDNSTPKKAFDSVMEFYPAETYVDLFGSEAARHADRARIKADLKIVYDFYDARPVKNKKGKAQGIVAAKGT